MGLVASESGLEIQYTWVNEISGSDRRGTASNGQASVAHTVWLLLGCLMKKLGYPQPVPWDAFSGVVPLKGLSQQCFPLKWGDYIFPHLAAWERGLAEPYSPYKISVS